MKGMGPPPEFRGARNTSEQLPSSDVPGLVATLLGEHRNGGGRMRFAWFADGPGILVPDVSTVTTHALLSASHSDTTAQAVSRGSLIYGNATPTWNELTLGGAAGSFLRRDANDVMWSTLVLPNAATQGDLLYASGANTIGNLADVAVGQVLVSGGVGAAPAYSASPTLTGLMLSGLTASTLIYSNATKAITSLANAAGYLYNNGAGVLSWAATAAPTAHNLLSTSHGDTAAAAVADGDIIIGNATPAWSRLAISVPAAGTLNYLGVNNAELRPSWKSASSNPGAAANILQSDPSGYLQLTRLGAGIAPSYPLHSLSTAGAQLCLSYNANAYTTFQTSTGWIKISNIYTAGDGHTAIDLVCGQSSPSKSVVAVSNYNGVIACVDTDTGATQMHQWWKATGAGGGTVFTTLGQLDQDGDLRVLGGLHVGSTATDPGAGEIFLNGNRVRGSVSSSNFRMKYIDALAVDAVAALLHSDAIAAFVIIHHVGAGTFALYHTSGGVYTTTEWQDPSGLFTTTKDNAGTINIYWDAGGARYEVQNKTAGAIYLGIYYFTNI